MKTLVLTVGLPRSGKSTWARKQGYPIVNPDAIRLSLHGQPFIKEAEPAVWAIAKYMVRALFLAGHDIVILDATNTTKKRRDEWLSDAWEVKYGTFGASEAECIRRCTAETAYLVRVIEHMATAYEDLEPQELAASFSCGT